MFLRKSQTSQLSKFCASHIFANSTKLGRNLADVSIKLLEEEEEEEISIIELC